MVPSPPKVWTDQSKPQAKKIAFHPQSFNASRTSVAIVVSLHECDMDAVELLRELKDLDHQLERGLAPNEVVATNQYMYRLRGRIAEGINQKRELLARLGVIQLEIQCQDRWRRVRGGSVLLPPVPTDSWATANSSNSFGPAYNHYPHPELTMEQQQDYHRHQRYQSHFGYPSY